MPPEFKEKFRCVVLLPFISWFKINESAFPQPIRYSVNIIDGKFSTQQISGYILMDIK